MKRQLSPFVKFRSVSSELGLLLSPIFEPVSFRRPQMHSENRGTFDETTKVLFFIWMSWPTRPIFLHLSESWTCYNLDGATMAEIHNLRSPFCSRATSLNITVRSCCYSGVYFLKDLFLKLFDVYRLTYDHFTFIAFSIWRLLWRVRVTTG